MNGRREEKEGLGKQRDGLKEGKGLNGRGMDGESRWKRLEWIERREERG